ncbi:MAG: 3-dehydroquinate synthase [Candidatus Acidiferrales bacterium]
MRSILIHSSTGSYRYVLGRGAVRQARGELRRLKLSDAPIFVLSSPRVWKHVRAVTTAALGAPVRNPILFDDNESKKNLATVERLCRALLRAGADRRAVLVAVGGGVVGDVAGYVAASYMRGVRVVHVPTTVVAMADSAIGGKTGVNLPEGKNQVGAFFPPRLVLADVDLLRSLPPREFRSGLYEVVKCGVIGDPELFRYLERDFAAVAARNPAALEYILSRSAALKARVVSRDEKDSGLREILNFGHTFGHALETVTRYRRFRHGEAVGWGMLCAAQLAVDFGILPPRDADRIARTVAQVGPLPAWPKVSAPRLIEIMRADKKSRGGKLRFVLPTRIGHAETVDGVPETLVRRTLEHLPRSAPSDASLATPHASRGASSARAKR